MSFCTFKIDLSVRPCHNNTINSHPISWKINPSISYLSFNQQSKAYLFFFYFLLFPFFFFFFFFCNKGAGYLLEGEGTGQK